MECPICGESVEGGRGTDGHLSKVSLGVAFGLYRSQMYLDERHVLKAERCPDNRRYLNVWLEGETEPRQMGCTTHVRVCPKGRGLDFDSFSRILRDVLLEQPSTDKAVRLAAYGHCWDGVHHKDWFFERIIEALGVDLDKVAQWHEDVGYGWSDGIAP